MSNPMRRRQKQPNTPAGPAPKSPIQRLDDLESSIMNLLQIAQTQTTKIEAIFGMLEAIQGVLGPDAIQDSAEAIAADKSREAIAVAVAQGQMVTVDTIALDSKILLVGHRQHGTDTKQRYVSIWVDKLTPEAKTALVGGGIDAIWTSPDGQTLFVDAIYQAVTPPATLQPSDEAVPAEDASS